MADIASDAQISFNKIASDFANKRYEVASTTETSRMIRLWGEWPVITKMIEFDISNRKREINNSIAKCDAIELISIKSKDGHEMAGVTLPIITDYLNKAMNINSDPIAEIVAEYSGSGPIATLVVAMNGGVLFTMSIPHIPWKLPSIGPHIKYIAPIYIYVLSDSNLNFVLNMKVGLIDPIPSGDFSIPNWNVRVTSGKAYSISQQPIEY